jgi:hypothetical protein
MNIDPALLQAARPRSTVRTPVASSSTNRVTA